MEAVPATAVQRERAKSDGLGGLRQGERAWNMASGRAWAASGANGRARN